MSDDDKVNILLVDDQPAQLVAYDAILADLGQNLVRASSGVEALEQLMRDEFAVILLDVSMPGMDGFETAQLIHEHPRFEKTPIIFVTALHVTDMDRLRGYRLGAVDYVYVPVIPEILRGKVSVLVELHLKRRELQRLNSRLERANAELEAANSSLVAEKQRELERMNRTLERANSELGHANATLCAEVRERERAEEALREADRRKDRFLAMLAHELRNPLTPILNAIQLLKLQPTGGSETSWARDVIERQTHHLSRIVEDLLDVSRIIHGKISLRLKPVDLSTVVTRAIESVRPLVEARKQSLGVELPSGRVSIVGDGVRLSQVIGNLLHNAAKYTDEGGRIRLFCEITRGSDDVPAVAIHVVDDGMGIAPEMLPHVFELFSQAEESVDRALGGLGIGLALVQWLVDMHGGTVEARSQGLGAGSDFIVTLPIQVIEEVPEQLAATPARNGDRPGRRRILLVDDNRDSATSMTLLLRRLGHEVETAYDGLGALDLVASFRPEVVFLDIGLPRIDGYETCRRARRIDAGRRAMIVALTGWGKDEDLRRSRDAGFDHHVVKPVDLSTLEMLLERVEPRVPPSANGGGALGSSDGSGPVLDSSATSPGHLHGECSPEPA